MGFGHAFAMFLRSLLSLVFLSDFFVFRENIWEIISCLRGAGVKTDCDLQTYRFTMAFRSYPHCLQLEVVIFLTLSISIVSIGLF